MWRKMVRGVLCLGIAFTVLTGCGNNNGNMDETAVMAWENGVSQKLFPKYVICAKMEDKNAKGEEL